MKVTKKALSNVIAGSHDNNQPSQPKKNERLSKHIPTLTVKTKTRLRTKPNLISPDSSASQKVNYTNGKNSGCESEAGYINESICDVANHKIMEIVDTSNVTTKGKVM